MNPVRSCVAFALLLSSVAGDTPTAAAELILAQAIQAQDACQSLGDDGEYALELLQKQVSRRATGTTKQNSNFVVPPVVDPELAETIADLAVESRTGKQRIEGLRMMLEDVQEGLDKAIDLADEKVSVSPKESLSVHGGSPSISSATLADFSAATAAGEAKLAELAGSTQLRANRVAEKALDIQREFRAIREDLNHIQLGDKQVGELSREGSLLSLYHSHADEDAATTDLYHSHADEDAATTDAVATSAMKSAVKSNDNMRAAEDLQRSQVATTKALDMATAEAATAYDNAAARPSANVLGVLEGEHRLFGEHSGAAELSEVQRKPAVFQHSSDRFAKQEQRAGAAAETAREAAAQTQHEEKRVASAAAAVDVARKNVQDMFARHENRAIGIAQAVDDATRAMKSRHVMQHQKSLDDATRAMKSRHVMQDQKSLDMKTEKTAETTHHGIQAGAALAAKQEAVYANQERALAELEKESVVVKHDNIAALQRQSTPHQVGKDNHVLVSQEAVDVAAKVVSAPWVEAARRAFEISKAEQLDGVPVSAVAMQSSSSA